MEFDLLSSLTVDSIKYHNTSINFQHLSNDVLRIIYPTNLQINVLDSVQVFYHGTPTGGGFGSFVSQPHQGSPAMWTYRNLMEQKIGGHANRRLQTRLTLLILLLLTPLPMLRRQMAY